jgi:tyrosine-protein kinase Etk/Wzc
MVRWRRMILISFLCVSTVTAGISLVIPPVYRATAVVYPPKEAQESFGLSALLGNLPMGLLGVGESTISASEFVPILQSRRVAEAIARKYDLKNRYHVETREELLLTVADKLAVELSREQFLNVSYEAETPELSSEITNSFVMELDRALQDRRKEQSGELRDYLEQRLARAEKEMVTAELAYNAFQRQNMVIDLEIQAKTQLESASTLFISLAELRVRREVVSRMMKPDHPQLKLLDIEIAATEETVDLILMGQSLTGKEDSDEPNKFLGIFIPFPKMPALGLQALQLMRDVEIRNAMYQFILQEYEKSRFEEEKETSLVVVLDRAMPPDFRSRPRRALMVAVAGGLSLAVSILLAFLFEAIQGMEGENRTKLDGILKELRLKRN